MSTNWDKRFLDLTDHIAQWSKDPSTKVGAVIVDNQRRIVGTGYNGFPRGLDDNPARYEDKKLKYKLVVHAEVNAILNAVKSVQDCTIYTNCSPCPRCMSVIIQSGIARVITKANARDVRVPEEIELASDMAIEAGVGFEQHR